MIKSISLESISISPSNASINQSQTQQFTATGTYSDGSSKNITTERYLDFDEHLSCNRWREQRTRKRDSRRHLSGHCEAR